jgi:hypothetical protein
VLCVGSGGAEDRCAVRVEPNLDRTATVESDILHASLGLLADGRAADSRTRSRGCGCSDCFGATRPRRSRRACEWRRHRHRAEVDSMQTPDRSATSKQRSQTETERASRHSGRSQPCPYSPFDRFQMLVHTVAANRLFDSVGRCNEAASQTETSIAKQRYSANMLLRLTPYQLEA